VYILLALLGCAPAVSPTQTPTNVLFLSIDTTRPDALGFFGGAADTPNLDALLGESLVMARHHSCSGWTYPSMVCATSGRSALDMGYTVQMEDLRPLPVDAVLPTDRLGELGWRTKLITTNNYIGDHTDFGRHYGDFEGLINRPADVVLEAARSSLSQMADSGDPWVLHAHFIDPHSPYSPPAGYADLSDLAPIDYDLDLQEEYGRVSDDWPTLDDDERSLIAEHMERRYLGELAYLDDQLGELLGEVEARGLSESTAIALMTDHGEQFWEHGDYGHGASLHREENSALAAIRWPGMAPGVWTGATTHQDIWPTLFDWMGLDPLEDFTGAPIGSADDDRPMPILRLRSENGFAGLIQGDAKLLYTWSEDGEVDLELYDLAADPGETRDLTAQEPALAAAMREALEPTLRRAFELGGPAYSGN